MKAVLYTEYGEPEVLKLTEVEKPVPKDNEVLIKVYATPVNYGDLIVRNLKNLPIEKFNMPDFLFPMVRLAFGFNKPKKKILGAEFSGVIEQTGSKVNNFKIGDEVIGNLEAALGANAEYICMKSNGLIGLKPKNISFEEAATIAYGGMTALKILNQININSPESKGKKILINGASGSIGSFAVQIAKAYGAEVTGVCSTPRLDYVKSLGADHVIDYTAKDFTKNGKTYDIILDVLGKQSFNKLKDSLNKNGIHLLGSFKTKALLQVWRTKFFSNKKCILGFTSYKINDLNTLKDLTEKGTIKPIIDKSFPLEKAAEAHSYIEDGNQKGYVVLTL